MSLWPTTINSYYTEKIDNANFWFMIMPTVSISKTDLKLLTCVKKILQWKNKYKFMKLVNWHADKRIERKDWPKVFFISFLNFKSVYRKKWLNDYTILLIISQFYSICYAPLLILFFIFLFYEKIIWEIFILMIYLFQQILLIFNYILKFFLCTHKKSY